MTARSAGSDGPQHTQRLCAFVAHLKPDELPTDVAHAARRGVLDFLGCAIAGSADPEGRRLLDALADIGGDRTTPVFGTGRRLGLIDAATVNGFDAHVLDYDDTRGTSPILAAAFAIAGREGASGAALIAAYALGIEVVERLGRAAPGHHRGGWHPTGTLGTLGAAAAAGRLAKLSVDQMVHAFGIAATQAAGMQQNRGTMCKPLHAGKGAANGVLAALLARADVDSATDILEGERGFCRVYSDVARPEHLTDGLGADWAVIRNGYKPYACGLVLHPTIDAMLSLRASSAMTPDDVGAIEITCHPMVETVTGRTAPTSGTESKFSANHTAAVTFIDGRAGRGQFTDERVRARDVVTLRQKVRLVIDERMRSDQARARVTGKGRSAEIAIDHALGSPANPLDDAALRAKFMDNAAPVIGADRARHAGDLLARLDELPDLADLIATCGGKSH